MIASDHSPCPTWMKTEHEYEGMREEAASQWCKGATDCRLDFKNTKCYGEGTKWVFKHKPLSILS